MQDIGGDLDDSAQGLPPNAYRNSVHADPNYVDGDYPHGQSIPFKEFAKKAGYTPTSTPVTASGEAQELVPSS